MNADAYLRKQGWKGSGHSLDSTGRGIKKPLLIAHKQDQLGLGKKKAAWTTDDQWWMRAFDQSLQSIGTGQESTLAQIQKKGISRAGLYGFFVRGECIRGTIEDESVTATDSSIPPSGASTPPTSASDTEAPVVKSKKERKEKTKGTALDNKKNSKNIKAVVRKLKKLSPKEKKIYKHRAALKKQTLEEYILRRIEKKSVKKSASR